MRTIPVCTLYLFVHYTCLLIENILGKIQTFIISCRKEYFRRWRWTSRHRQCWRDVRRGRVCLETDVPAV